MTVHPNQAAVAQPRQRSTKRPVAGYLRSATELEADSLRQQIEAVVRYARDRGMQLVRVYCDECGSGLRIEGRTGLPQMFRDIESGAGDFDAILLLDPSRWGRFHDPDQRACLEYACRKAGIEVHYCAEGFDDDETPLSSIVKSLKRFMAAEYERELAARKRRAAPSAAGDDVANRGDSTGKRPEAGAGGQSAAS